MQVREWSMDYENHTVDLLSKAICYLKLSDSVEILIMILNLHLIYNIMANLF